MNNSIDFLKQSLNTAFKDKPVYKAILFGSYAKGNADVNSDIDLVIDTNGELNGLKFYSLLEALTISLGKNIDLIDISEIDKNSDIYNTINNEGVIVYDRTH